MAVSEGVFVSAPVIFKKLQRGQCVGTLIFLFWGGGDKMQSTSIGGCGYKMEWPYQKVSHRCVKMNLYSFVSITRHRFLSSCQIVVSKKLWRFFDAVRGFYINSSPESNRLFGGNGECFYPLAFFHKPFRCLHYCRRGNRAFQHADKSVAAVFDQSEHIKLTHVSSAVALFLFMSIGLLHFDHKTGMSESMSECMSECENLSVAQWLSTEFSRGRSARRLLQVLKVTGK